MLSRRVPERHEPNAWTLARRVAGARLLDLSEANPTRVGLGGSTPEVSAALAAAAAAPYAPDPRGLPMACEAVARYYASRGLTVAPGQVVLTAGTSEAYAHLFRLLADPGERFMAPRPGYPLFEPLARLEAVELAHYDLALDGRWRLDLDSLERVLTPRTRAIIVVQPNHPTGSCLDVAEVAALEILCARHGLAIVCDEVFGDYEWGGDSGVPRGLPSLLGDRRVPTFVLSGLSKVCGMPQMKCSWIVATGPSRLRDEALGGLEWVSDLFLSVSGPVQTALPALLEARHTFQARVRERLTANLARLRSTRGIETLPADGGWVALVRMPPRRTDEEWAIELLRRDVSVHPGYFYDVEGERVVVVSLIVEPDVFAEGVGRIAEAVTERGPELARLD